MAVTVTQQALDVIRRSLDLAGTDPAEMGVRLRLAGGDVRPRLSPGPEPGDIVVEQDGIRVFVDHRIVDEIPEVEIGVSPEHERLVVRPAASG